MELNGANVLIDGYNLERPEGTGIKSYGVSLSHALGLLGANVGVLYGSRKGSKDPVLSEVLFFDLQDREHKRLSRLRYLAFFRSRPKPVIRNKDVVIKRGLEEFINTVEPFTLEECYRSALLIYRMLGISKTLTVPGRKIQLWHATYPLPVRVKGAVKITTIHDLVPLRLPYATLDDKRLFYRLVKSSLKESAVIITVSEHSKKDILNVFDVAPEKIHVTYEPVAPESLEPKLPSFLTLEKYKLKRKRYVLFVGAIEPKKNLGRLIEAYSLTHTHMPLVVVGPKGWLWQKELEGKSMENVRCLGRVSAAELRSLYSEAYCFVFPSLYEGFGLPPLEAMSMGCPVIASNVASLPEVCGNAALYVDPYEVLSIKEALQAVLQDPKLAQKLSEAGRQRVALFDMKHYLERLRTAYASALQKL